MVTRIKKFLSPPTFPDNEDATRAARVLNSLLLSILFVLVILSVAVPLAFEEKHYNFYFLGLLFIALSAAYRIMRRGRVRAAGIMFITVLWIVLTLFLLMSGGMQSIIPVFYVSGTVIAGLLLGIRAAIVYAAGCSFAGLAMVLWEMSGNSLPRIFPVPPRAGWLDMTLALIITITALNIAFHGLEHALSRVRQSQARFETLFDEAPIMYLIVQRRENSPIIVNCNSTFLKQLGYTKFQVQGQPLADFYAPQSRPLIMKNENMEQMINRLAKKPVERYLLARDGRIVPTLLQMAPEIDDTGTIIGTLSMFLDITERKKAESQRDEMLERVKISLREKETLLRELYHRTKNNMQVISALLDLQAVYTDDERLREAFVDTRNRIHSMALVHQKLYEARDLSYVNLKEYISDLLKLLLSSFDIFPGKIELLSDMKDVSVMIDAAIPCGLIINELFSNIFKHAFPGDRSGKVHVELYKIDHEIFITVSDNGVGVPRDFDFRKHGRLGLQNVISIAEKQLGGKVSFESDGGIMCRLQFRDDHYKSRI